MSPHLWRDIPTGPDVPRVVTAVVEIPRFERNKYELDKELGVFRLDRVLHSAVHYPGDYGFIPRTLAEDDDPLDILVIMTLPVFPGCLVPVRPVGLFRMEDRGVPDDKILAVPLHDPYAREVDDISDLPPHTLKEIEHFFQIYKDLEGHRVTSLGWEGSARAHQVILEAVERFAGTPPPA